MRRRRIESSELLAAVVELADDGFAARRALTALFPHHSERDLIKSTERLARAGLLLERRAPDGAIYVALSGEGWRVVRSR